MEERIAAQRVTPGGAIPLEESVAVEEPLAILLNGEKWATIMRTPGQDEDLVRGLLYSEGIVDKIADIDQMNHNGDEMGVIGEFNDIPKQGFVRSSSCGICGIETPSSAESGPIPADGFQIPFNGIEDLLASLRSAQSVFDSTGGVHAVALFNADGLIVDIAEDVGRHNAMDKVVGRGLDTVPFSDLGFLLSGRVSFEMVQKAVRAGSPCIIAIGAPTTLAVDIARQHGITLIGFAREGRFNVYAGAWRLEED